MYFRVYRTNLAQETIHKSWAHAHMATPISSPYASGWIFLFRPRKVVETFRIHQNVCNGHVYKQLMKQHILQNAFFLRYSRKTDFLMLGQHEISYFDARITVVARQTTRQICTEVFVGLPCKFSPGDNETKFRITAKQPSPFSGHLPLVHFLHFGLGRSTRFFYAPKYLKWPC